MQQEIRDKKWFGYSRRALRFIFPFKVPVIFIMALALAMAGLGAIEPLVMKYIFDRLETGQFSLLAKGVLMLIGLNLLREGVGGFSNWLTWRVRLKINEGLLEATVSRLHALPITYHKEETVGGIMTKLDKGINGFVGALSEIAFNVFPGIVYLLISLAVMFSLDWRMSLLVLFFAPIPAVIGMWAAKEQTRRDKLLVESWARIFSRFNEVLSGIFTVKSFVAEKLEQKRFMDGVHRANALVLKGVATDTGVGALKNLVSIAAKIASIAVGGVLVMKGEATLGTLVAFLGYLDGLFGPVQGLTGVYQTIRRASVSLGIIFSILDARDSIKDHPDARPIKALKGEVIFNNVTFAYKDKRNLLKDIYLYVEPGEVLALVGPSGAGKSTMMALLQRLYEPTSGTILIDGMDIRRLEQRSLRTQIGIVSQDAPLFNDTIRNNISYGTPDAALEDIQNAAKAANAHDFIMKLPYGYDTLTGERGSFFSAGERQRISIARALIKDPPILILDEATSALDAESESLVQEALRRVMRGRTTFIIAHRLSTVVSADKILVLKDGAIIEEGSHRELMLRNRYYASLVRRQMKGFIDASAA